MLNPSLSELRVLAAQTAEMHGFQLHNIQLLTYLNNLTVQIQIQQQGSGELTLDDCAAFSAPMDAAIKASGVLTEAYVLEISSPGIGDLLQTDRDFRTFRGFPVSVIFCDANSNEQTITGLLLKRSDDHVHLNMHGQVKRIPRDEILSVCLTRLTG